MPGLPDDARQTVVFTPTTIGWYRIASGTNASMGGRVELSGSYDGRTSPATVRGLSCVSWTKEFAEAASR